ncbi:hypothetical protein QR680_011774 [Steinernema hermaphroditum]|uniref:Uncharacterized protein n=1 Tax=Steinernema hermaphroditum TaxID=289476 RepID=A0AA39HZP2_9BILA|nr:hypothetical protein QR680_011774 [Steinernema hermaphroditum]
MFCIRVVDEEMMSKFLDVPRKEAPLTKSDLSKLVKISRFAPRICMTDFSSVGDESVKGTFYRDLLHNQFHCRGGLYIEGTITEEKFAFLRTQLDQDFLTSLTVPEELLSNERWLHVLFTHFFKGNRFRQINLRELKQLDDKFVQIMRIWASCASPQGIEKKVFVKDGVFYEEFHDDLNVRTVDLDKNTVEVTAHLPENPSRVVQWKQFRNNERHWCRESLELEFVEI